MNVFSLDLGLRADDKQAIAALTRVERAGKQTAMTFAANWTSSTNTVAGTFAKVEAAGKRSSAAIAQSASAGAAQYQKWGGAALRVTGAVGMVADAATSSDKSLQALLRAGSGVAFMFGPAGAVVGSLGIATSLIMTMFSKTREELEKTRKSAIDNMAKLRSGLGLGGTIAESNTLENERRALEAERNALTPRINAAQAAFASGTAGAGATGSGSGIRIAASALGELQRQAKEADDKIIALDISIAKLNARAAGLATGDFQAGQATDAATKVLEQRAKAAALQKERNRNFQQGLGAFGVKVDPWRIQSPTGRVPGVTARAGGMTDEGRAEQASNFAAKREEALAIARQEFKALQDAMGGIIDTYVVGGIGNAIQAGFESAFSGEGIGGLLKGFTGSIIGSLGQMFIELGKHLIGFGTIMTTLKKAMTSIFSTGPGAVVAGVALIALGAAMSAGAGKIMGGGGSRGGGGGGGSYGAAGARGITDSTTSYLYNPATMDMTKVNPIAPVHFTVIGQNDIDAQNRITAMVRSAQGRGA